MIKLKQPIDVITYRYEDGITWKEQDTVSVYVSLLPTDKTLFQKRAYRVDQSSLYLWLSDDEIIEVQDE